MGSKKSCWVAVLAVLSSVSAIVFSGNMEASAVTGVDWQPGYIISDSVMANSSSMSVDQIQSWLESKETNCTAANGEPCLKTYNVPTVSRAASSGGQCGSYAGAQEPASRIIWKVAQACHINPQVLLVMLQKEQGLVTATSPTESQYRIAMGYGCPDTAACDTKFYGFYNQVYWAAWQLHEYIIDPNYWHYKVGSVEIGFNPSASCGSSVVEIVNRATAALYNYTPYQPNAVALANLNGLGDGCSAYGNRNFWVYFNNWFGSPIGKVNPIGVIDDVQSVPGAVHVSGWAFDPDTNDPIPVAIYVNGQGITVTASNSRPDVGAVYGVGNAHGYDQVLANIGTGPQQVCVYAINYGVGANALLGCVTVNAMTGNPIGVIDSITSIGSSISGSGWAFDPDSTASIEVEVYVDNVFASSFAANASRPDVAAAYPGYGDAHGYSFSVNASPGPHTVCIYGVNSGPGANKSFGCRAFTAQSGAPLGVVDSFVVSPGQVTVAGWAFDPDTTNSIPVAVYVDTTGAAFTANTSRLDVAAVYGHGAAHGYNASVPTPPGNHSVCVFAIDATDPASHTGLRCQTITAMSGSPVGVVDSLTVSGGAIVASGWVYDPDTVQPSQIRVSLDGVATVTIASNSRPDVASVYPPYGAAHGYSVNVTTVAGSHRVCVYGVNSGYGSDALLGCKTLTL